LSLRGDDGQVGLRRGERHLAVRLLRGDSGDLDLVGRLVLGRPLRGGEELVRQGRIEGRLDAGLGDVAGKAALGVQDRGRSTAVEQRKEDGLRLVAQSLGAEDGLGRLSHRRISLESSPHGLVEGEAFEHGRSRAARGGAVAMSREHSIFA